MRTIDELKNQKINIDNSLNKELNLNYSYYEKSKDTEFEAEDYYFKLCLFSLYRAIEEEIHIIIDYLKDNSKNKDFYGLLYKDSKKTYWIENNEFVVILNDLKKYRDKIINQKLIDEINKIKYTQKLEKEEITRHGLNDVVNIDFFTGKYSECKKNRNILMHQITLNDISLTKSSIINAMIIYSYLSLIIDDILN